MSFLDLSHLGSAIVQSAITKNPTPVVETVARKGISKGLSKFKEKNDKLYDLYPYGLEQKDIDFLTSLTKESRHNHDTLVEILNRNPPISIVLICLRGLFGSSFYVWEPESLFLELVDNGVDVDDLLMDKIGAGMALAVQPSFLWDARVFENFCLVANDIELEGNIIQGLEVPQICWGVVEGLDILRREQPEANNLSFDYPIELYAAAAMHLNHYMLAPDELSFCQEELDNYNSNEEMGRVIEEDWNKFYEEYEEKEGKISLEDMPEDLITVQLKKLLGCKLYIKERLDLVEAFHKLLGV